MSQGIKKILKYGFSIIILIGSVYLAVKGIDFAQFGREFLKVDYIWALIPLPIMMFSHILRAYRWKTILKPIFHAKSILNLFSAVMVGYFFNNLTPRGGEFIRPYVYAKREKVSYSSLLATIVLERVLDLITLLALFALAFVILQDKLLKVLPQDIDPTKIIYVFGIIMVVAISGFYPPFVELILRKIVKPLSENYYNKILEKFNKFRKGFGIIKRPSAYLRLSIESLSIWICYALPMYIMFFGFHFQNTANLGIWDALLLIIVSGVGYTIAPTPGAIGMYHWLIVTTMVTFYGISREAALTYATITHGLNFITQVGFGAIFLIHERIRKIPSQEDIQEEISILDSKSKTNSRLLDFRKKISRN